MEPWTRHQKTQWQLIRQVAFSKDAEQHRRCMALLLLQLHKINQKQFTRRCRQLYKLDPILGPQAVAWGLRTMGEITPAGKERRFYLTEADKALDDAAIMKKNCQGMEWVWRTSLVGCAWETRKANGKVQQRFCSESIRSQVKSICLKRGGN